MKKKSGVSTKLTPFQQRYDQLFLPLQSMVAQVGESAALDALVAQGASGFRDLWQSFWRMQVDLRAMSDDRLVDLLRWLANSAYLLYYRACPNSDKATIPDLGREVDSAFLKYLKTLEHPLHGFMSTLKVLEFYQLCWEEIDRRKAGSVPLVGLLDHMAGTYNDRALRESLKLLQSMRFRDRAAVAARYGLDWLEDLELQVAEQTDREFDRLKNEYLDSLLRSSQRKPHDRLVLQDKASKIASDGIRALEAGFPQLEIEMVASALKAAEAELSSEARDEITAIHVAECDLLVYLTAVDYCDYEGFSEKEQETKKEHAWLMLYVWLEGLGDRAILTTSPDKLREILVNRSMGEAHTPMPIQKKFAKTPPSDVRDLAQEGLRRQVTRQWKTKDGKGPSATWDEKDIFDVFKAGLSGHLANYLNKAIEHHVLDNAIRKGTYVQDDRQALRESGCSQEEIEERLQMAKEDRRTSLRSQRRYEEVSLESLPPKFDEGKVDQRAIDEETWDQKTEREFDEAKVFDPKEHGPKAQGQHHGLEELGLDLSGLTPKEQWVVKDVYQALGEGYDLDSKTGMSFRQRWGKDYGANIKAWQRARKGLNREPT